MNHPLHYYTMAARQNARWALMRKLRAAVRRLLLLVAGFIGACLAGYGLAAIAERVFHFVVTFP